MHCGASNPFVVTLVGNNSEGCVCSPAPPTDKQSMPFPSSTRVFVSPYARSLLAEQGRTAAGIQGTGYSGAVTSRDVIAAGGRATAAAPSAATGSFTELPLTGMRKVGGAGWEGNGREQR